MIQRSEVPSPNVHSQLKEDPGPSPTPPARAQHSARVRTDLNLHIFLLIHIWTWSSSPTLPWHAGVPIKYFQSSSDGFGHVNFSELIPFAPKSPCSFSQVTNTCLNHIRGTALYATCNNTFNYDWLEFKFWFLLEHNQSWMGNFYSDN